MPSIATSAANTAANSSSVASANAATNAAAQQSLNSSYTDFLKLLTTQLQNRGPDFNPADTNQVTQEIAQLSEVQGQLQTNTYLAQLINLFSANQTSNAVSYISKQIDAASPAPRRRPSLRVARRRWLHNLPMQVHFPLPP